MRENPMNVSPWRAGALLLAFLLASACGKKETGSVPAGGAPAAPVSASQDAAAPPAEGQPAIAGPADIDWILVRLGDQTVRPNGRKQMQLRLLAGDKEAHGQATCNTFRSRFELDAAGLRFGPLAVTRMACPGLEIEKRYLEAIQQTSRWSIQGDRLLLSDASGKPVAEFAQKSGD
jgi:heat shock protein HslJ